MGMADRDGRPPWYHPEQPQPSPLSGLARLPLVYSLTFEEFQNALGGTSRDFGSMNMDELVRNIWTAEEVQATASAAVPIDLVGGGCSGIQRQGSLALPRTISLKTVDEVWRELFSDSSAVAADVLLSSGSGVDVQPKERQPTLGEITLEEFLLRAGVAREEIPPATGPVSISFDNGDSLSKETCSKTGLVLGLSQIDGGAVASRSDNPIMNFGIPGLRPPYSPSVQLGNRNAGYVRRRGTDGEGIVDVGRTIADSGEVASAFGLGSSGVMVAAMRSRVNPLPSGACHTSKDTLPSMSPSPRAFNMGLGKRRGGLEKVTERRQRRMIKNRESAARSRDRKQAYTMELEAEVMKLKEQNKKLQNKQVEIMEWQKNLILRIINRQHEPKRPRLMRTQTGPW